MFYILMVDEKKELSRAENTKHLEDIAEMIVSDIIASSEDYRTVGIFGDNPGLHYCAIRLNLELFERKYGHVKVFTCDSSKIDCYDSSFSIDEYSERLNSLKSS